MTDRVRSRPQLSDEAVSYVRDQITSGTLPPGAHVRPESIAAELDISTTPAREALQTLRSEGFLELAPRRGFRVAHISGDDVRDMYLAHSWVSGELAARAAAAMTPDLKAHLVAIHDSLTAAAEAGDLLTLEQLNHEFHRAINVAAGASRLTWLLQTLTRYAPRRFYASIEGWSRTTVEDHADILSALESSDSEQARAAMSAHVIRAGEQLARHIDARLADSAAQ